MLYILCNIVRCFCIFDSKVSINFKLEIIYKIIEILRKKLFLVTTLLYLIAKKTYLYIQM